MTGSPPHSITSQAKVRSSVDGVGMRGCRDFQLPLSAICTEVKLERVFVEWSGDAQLSLVQAAAGKLVVGGGCWRGGEFEIIIQSLC